MKFVDAAMGSVGAFSWFPVHGTSMNRTNQLISGDNKGAAARFMEDWFQKIMPTNKTGMVPGQPSPSVMHKVRRNAYFVAAFCQSNVGDTTPNTLGPFCMDSGLPCDFHTSTCNGKSQQCVGRGPAYANSSCLTS